MAMTSATMFRPKTKRLWSFDELAAQLPETNNPTELWDGEVIMSPAPKPSHQEIVLNFASLLKAHVLAKNCGKVFISPIDVVFSQHRAVQPDVVFVSNSKLHIIQDCIRGVPDLVAEVLSAGSWRRDRVEKKELYEQLNLPEYWILDPETATTEVFTLVKGAYRLHSRAGTGQTAISKVLPGFKVSWSQLTV